jgi:hypothetical protein
MKNFVHVPISAIIRASNMDIKCCGKENTCEGKVCYLYKKDHFCQKHINQKLKDFNGLEHKCNGLTQTGKNCSYKAVFGFDYCKIHFSQMPAGICKQKISNKKKNNPFVAKRIVNTGKYHTCNRKTTHGLDYCNLHVAKNIGKVIAQHNTNTKSVIGKILNNKVNNVSSYFDSDDELDLSSDIESDLLSESGNDMYQNIPVMIDGSAYTLENTLKFSI